MGTIDELTDLIREDGTLTEFFAKIIAVQLKLCFSENEYKTGYIALNHPMRVSLGTFSPIFQIMGEIGLFEEEEIIEGSLKLRKLSGKARDLYTIPGVFRWNLRSNHAVASTCSASGWTRS